jgi:hypothetical protein
MKARRFGRIVNIASAHGLTALAVQVGVRDRQARPDRPVEDGGASRSPSSASPRTRSAPAT